VSAAPGWYPDPAGQPGRFRYWDGRGWSATTSASPQSQPLAPAPGPPRRRSPLPWILAAAAILVVITIVSILVVRGLVGGTIIDRGRVTSAPPSADICPDAVQPSASPAAQTGGRVTSGRLSYAKLGAPFSEPYWDRRVPFGRDVQSQQATVEADPNGTPTWVASVLIARLLAGDGFFGPEQGARVVASCVTGKFYGNAAVTRKDTRNKAITVDGHPAWTIESHLSFQLPKIKTTGETMIIVVVDTGDDEAGLFYASIPDTSPQFMEPARQALASLKVG
jgi:hypothetical protein